MPRYPHPVKLAIAELGVTQREFAERIGVSGGTLNHVVNARIAPWPALKARIAEELGRPEEQLFPDAVDRLLEERRRAGYPGHLSDSAAVEVASILRRSGGNDAA